MDWTGFFRTKKPASAATARDRLMVAVAWQRDQDGRHGSTADAGPSYLPQMRDEILAVIRKYAQVGDDAVKVNLQRAEGLDVLEMNITLPEAKPGI
jgi:cell division topological specificity factor